jgi:hypothetical protein
MTPFQLAALLLTVLWLGLVVGRFRRSSSVLIGGLFALGLFTLAALAVGQVTLDELGLAAPQAWFAALGFSLAGLVVMVAYSPLADRLAARWFAKPPTLHAFGAIQQSTGRLIAGIAAAWGLGGMLEELVARGIVLKSIESGLAAWISPPAAAAIAICLAAAGVGLMHLYQGERAAVIITQLSLLLGVLFVVSGYNLWAVIICHGLYDTIAFVRFANKKSKYSHLDQDQAKTEPKR